MTPPKLPLSVAKKAWRRAVKNRAQNAINFWCYQEIYWKSQARVPPKELSELNCQIVTADKNNPLETMHVVSVKNAGHDLEPSRHILGAHEYLILIPIATALTLSLSLKAFYGLYLHK